MVGMLLGTALGSIAVPAFAGSHPSIVPAATDVGTPPSEDDAQTRSDEIVVKGKGRAHNHAPSRARN